MSGSQSRGTAARRTLTRRTVVAAAGGAGLTAALAACGDGGGGGGDGGDGERVVTEGGGDGARETTASPSEPVGPVIAQTADIPEGGGKVIGDLVITQPSPGRYKAFSAKCTHQGCKVRSVSDNVINCPCHNSDFDAETGDVQGGPARSPLPSRAIQVEAGAIRLA
ncbi:Rieske (2Fe-2S) protein [Streptomyces sp. NPDC057638]|uniref:Rieske (2Fe-2S) protein n=1 Tax=Streptomyces sp. NPDC057638 TaxID=3346190 RepID=UPI0036A3ECB5